MANPISGLLVKTQHIPWLRKIIEKLVPKNLWIVREIAGMTPQGDDGVDLVGHRNYVGGQGDFWDVIGKLQFEFLKEQGLTPDDILLDIGCGSLRGGVHFVPYLNEGHYLAVDREQKLIDIGIEQELGTELVASKKPEFIISKDFDFREFSKTPTFALAQSIFTHLAPGDIELCLKNLRDVVEPGAQFFATFHEVTKELRNPSESHSHKRFLYTRQMMEKFGSSNGWDVLYIGNWGHPRNDKMLKFVAK